MKTKTKKYLSIGVFSALIITTLSWWAWVERSEEQAQMTLTLIDELKEQPRVEDTSSKGGHESVKSVESRVRNASGTVAFETTEKADTIDEAEQKPADKKSGELDEGSVKAKTVVSTSVKSVSSSNNEEREPGFWRDFQMPSESVLRARLSPLAYRVTQKAGTEEPFENPYWDNERAGIYVDVISGEPLFSSIQKFHSGTGWPSFAKPLPGVDIVTREDYLIGTKRIEVLSPYADSHLGHVFSDGPTTLEESGGAEPTGLRYCLNSAALRFVPVSKMTEEGYGAYLYLFE